MRRLVNEKEIREVFFDDSCNIEKIELRDDTINIQHLQNNEFIHSDNKGYFTIEYDSIGNPIKYMEPYSNQSDNMEWTRGHILKKCKGTKFEYNSSGYRTKKNDKVYFLDGDKFVAETLRDSELLHAKKRIMIINYGLSGPEFLTVTSALDDQESSYVLRRDLR